MKFYVIFFCSQKYNWFFDWEVLKVIICDLPLVVFYEISLRLLLCLDIEDEGVE